MNFNYKIYRLYANFTSFPRKKPLIILGNQKTGTSAIASLMGEATQFSYCIDVFCHLGNLQQRLFEKDINFNQFINRSRDFFSKKIVKEPSFTFFYPELKVRFPKANYILIIRDPFENIRSICNRLKINGKESMTYSDYDFSGLHYDWKYILQGEKYGHKGKTIIETLAKRVSGCYNVYKKNSTNITLVKYEDFLSNKVNFINTLAESVGYKVKKDITKKVNIQYQPKGKDIDPKDFFSNENYSIILNECTDLISDHYK